MNYWDCFATLSLLQIFFQQFKFVDRNHKEKNSKWITVVVLLSCFATVVVYHSYKFSSSKLNLWMSLVLSLISINFESWCTCFISKLNILSAFCNYQFFPPMDQFFGCMAMTMFGVQLVLMFLCNYFLLVIEDNAEKIDPVE